MIRLTNILIKAIFLGIFRDISIGLHSRDFHTPISAHCAVGKCLITWLEMKMDKVKILGNVSVHLKSTDDSAV